MPAISDAPTGVGATNSWNLGAGATKAAAVAANDGDTSYIWAAAAGGATQLFTFPAVPGGAVDPLNTVILYGAWKRQVLGSSRQFYMKYNTSTNGSDLDSSLVTGSYATINPAYTASGSGLTQAAAGGEHGMFMQGGTGFEVWCTFFSRFIDWTYVAGGFIYMLSLFGSAIGAGLMLEEMPKLAAYIRGNLVEGGRRRYFLKTDELTQAWREWREYRHPVYAF